MELEILPQEFAVCKVGELPPGPIGGGFAFTARTDRETSLVCEAPFVPKDAVAAERGWRAIRAAGSLDFSLVGVLAGISSALADRGISIFTVSTYDTDYILVKSDKLDAAADALAGDGYIVFRK